MGKKILVGMICLVLMTPAMAMTRKNADASIQIYSRTADLGVLISQNGNVAINTSNTTEAFTVLGNGVFSGAVTASTIDAKIDWGMIQNLPSGMSGSGEIVWNSVTNKAVVVTSDYTDDVNLQKALTVNETLHVAGATTFGADVSLAANTLTAKYVVGKAKTLQAAKSSNYTIVPESDEVIFASGSGTVITLPAVGSATGMSFTVKKVDAGGAITVNTTGGKTIDGIDIYLLSGQNEYVTVTCDGANWFIVSSN